MVDINNLSAQEQNNFLLAKLVEQLGGEKYTIGTTTRYLFYADNATNLTNAQALLAELGISDYNAHDSLQSGVKELTFKADDAQFDRIATLIKLKSYAISAETKRLPIAGSIGSVTATVSDAKVGSTDGTVANVKYLKVASDGTLYVSTTLSGTSAVSNGTVRTASTGVLKTVVGTAQDILAVNANRKGYKIVSLDTSTGTAHVTDEGSTPSAIVGEPIAPYGNITCSSEMGNLVTGVIKAYCASGTAYLWVVEYT